MKVIFLVILFQVSCSNKPVEAPTSRTSSSDSCSADSCEPLKLGFEVENETNLSAKMPWRFKAKSNLDPSDSRKVSIYVEGFENQEDFEVSGQGTSEVVIDYPTQKILQGLARIVVRDQDYCEFRYLKAKKSQDITKTKKDAKKICADFSKDLSSDSKIEIVQKDFAWAVLPSMQDLDDPRFSSMPDGKVGANAGLKGCTQGFMKGFFSSLLGGVFTGVIGGAVNCVTNTINNLGESEY